MSEIIQKQVLRKAIESPTFSKDVLPKLPLSAFDSNKAYKDIVNIIHRYYQKKSNVLTEETLLTLLEEKLDRMKRPAEEQQEYFKAVHDIYEVRDSSNDDTIDQKIEAYIKKELRMELLKKAVQNINNEQEMANIDKEFREIMLLNVSGNSHEVINVIDDTEMKRRLLQTLGSNVISTGFKSIDAINDGGLAKGELGIVVAGSGTGKTLLLTNLAANYTKQRYNVLFVALEELENRMILRFEQSLLRQSKSTILTGKRLNEQNFDKLQDFYKSKREYFGNLFFARYSPGTVTPAKVEQLISDIMIRDGIRIDVVVIDYPELFRNPNAKGNEADDGGKLFEEMRRIGQDYDVVMWTAAQMNRTAYSAIIRTAEHMEGSHRKKNAAELVLAVNQTPEEYNAGFIRLYVDKVRNPPEGGFDRMIGLKVIGSAMTVRDYKNEHEKNEHSDILREADNARENTYKNKKKSNQEMPDFASEINAAIQANRGAVS